MNAPQPIGGFGKLGNFCRKILAYARSNDIPTNGVVIELMPVGATAPPSAEVTSTPSGKLIKIKLGAGASGSGGTIDVTSVNSADEGTPVDEVDNVNRLTFEMADPDSSPDHLTISDNGGGEAIVKFPTERITGAVSGAPKTKVFVTDGTAWDDP